MESGPAEPTRVDEIQDIWSFLKSIDWTENWFILLILFHVTFLLLSVLTRNQATIQAVLFVVLLLGVYSAEMINEWAAKNWRLFANQQYFDSGGLFISIVFSTPALFNCLIMVIIWLRNSALLMSELRQMKITKRAAALKKTKNEETESSTESTETVSTEDKKNK